jgi:hypothetical protein
MSHLKRSRKYREGEAFVSVKKALYMKERAEDKPEDLWSQFFTSSLGVCGIQVRNVKYSTNILV